MSTARVSGLAAFRVLSRVARASAAPIARAALIASIACAGGALGGGMLAGCKGGRTQAAMQKEAFGEVQSADDVDLAPNLAMARAIVLHKDRPAQGAVPARPAQRVFVTVYSHAAPVVTTALGDSLMSGVIAASEAAAQKASGADESMRIELDVVSQVEPSAFESEVRIRASDSGLVGYLLRDATHLGFVLPAEMITHKLIDVNKVDDGSVKVARDRVLTLMTERAGLPSTDIRDMTVYRFHTTARVEATRALDPNGTRALAVHRTMLDRPPPMSPDDLLAAVRAGADYLSRVINDKGRYVYLYHPVEDENDRAYGMLRHAGSTYALLEAYGELGTARYREKAELALANMKEKLRTTPDGSYLSDNLDEEQQKVGGGGLALVALAKHAATTGSRDNLETMRSLARFIVHQQYPDGHFRANVDVEREDESQHGKKLKKEVSYFPGEAILGLMRLYAVDPQPQWLEAAKKGADYLIFTRDVHETEDTQIHDHWLSYALNELYRETQTQAYADHSFKIARAILKAMKTPANAPAPDYVSTFYDFAETTPASTRLEAFAADMELSRFMEKPIDWLEGPSIEIARYMRSQQFDVESAFFIRDPSKVIGGVRESLANCDIRIDYVQHAMSAWLHLARVLRDPAYGGKKAAADAGAAVRTTGK
jgi:hypothetical protein